MKDPAAVIFVVSGEDGGARGLARHLEGAGFEARCFADAGSVLKEMEAHRPALFLVGPLRSDGEELELCRRLRARAELAKTPIIFVARASEAHRIAALEAGADDFLAHPANARELVARVKAVLRRYDPPRSQEVLQIGALGIDRMAMKVVLNGREIPLTATEFRLLEHLARNRGRVTSREQLLSVLWPRHVTARAIDVYVRRVRAKIERDPQNPDYLVTVRGTGYRLNAA